MCWENRHDFILTAKFGSTGEISIVIHFNSRTRTTTGSQIVDVGPRCSNYRPRDGHRTPVEGPLGHAHEALLCQTLNEFHQVHIAAVFKDIVLRKDNLRYLSKLLML